MIKPRLLCLVLAALPAAAETKVFPTKGFDYTKVKTFQWLAPRVFTKYQGPVDNDPTVAPMIKKAVGEQLMKKGMTEVTENPDVQILAAGAERGSSTAEAFFAGYFVDHFYGYAVPMYQVFNNYNREGVLAVGLVDPKTKKGVWVGFDSEGLGRGEIGDIEKAIQKAASNLFKKYPPK